MDQPCPTETTRATRKMFIRDLVLNASIGVHAHEHAAAQRVRINLDLTIADDAAAGKISRGAVGADELGRVVDYEALANQVRKIAASGHVQLVETLAERLCEACLADQRVISARARVEKLDIFADAASVGVEVERWNR